jgi:hypothetical protein
MCLTATKLGTTAWGERLTIRHIPRHWPVSAGREKPQRRRGRRGRKESEKGRTPHLLLRVLCVSAALSLEFFGVTTAEPL